MSRHARRRGGETSGDAGTDSFLDILANLVGILVILVVVVAIRVQRTVPARVGDSPPVAEAPVPETTTEPVAAPPRPTLADRAIDVAFAPPAPQRLPEPKPSKSLKQESARLAAEIASLQEQLAALPAAVDVPENSQGMATLALESDTLRKRSADLIALTSARARDLARLENAHGRLVRELEELEDPPAQIESLKHEVRSLAKAAGSRQLYLHLENGRLTVLPSDELVERAYRHQRTNLKTPRYDGVYSGTVGPVDGVTLSYEARRAAASPMDVLNGGPVLASASRFWFEVTSEAISEPIARAIQPGSEFRRTLASVPAGTTLTCVVKPDSYAAARVLQDFAQSRSQRLAFLPTAAELPAIFSAGGSPVMTQ